MDAMTVAEARHILGVQPDSSALEVRRAYHALALRNHPDKGGNEEDMKQIVHAYQLLTESASTAASSAAAPQHPNRQNRWTSNPRTVSKPSPPPSDADRAIAVAEAQEFVDALSQNRRAEMKTFMNNWIKRVMRNPLWPCLIDYFARCLEVLARRTTSAIAAHGVQSWEAIGF